MSLHFLDVVLNNEGGHEHGGGAHPGGAAEVLVEPKNQDVGLEFSAGDSRSLIMGVPSIGPIPFSWVAELSLTSCPVCWTL